MNGAICLVFIGISRLINFHELWLIDKFIESVIFYCPYVRKMQIHFIHFTR